LRLRRYEVALPDLDPAHDGLRIAHLTDIHVGLVTPRARILRAIELVRRARPDITVLTGDFVCYARRFVEPMGELLAGIGGVVACVLGNHDYWTHASGVARALERCGYAVLRNQHFSLRVRGADLHVIGIDDGITGHDDVPRAFAKLSRARHGTRLALSHAPELADRAVAHGAQLVLAGHTHGGHVRIPRLTERIFERMGHRYLAGFYPIAPGGAGSARRASGLLYVNCGVGSSSIPLRAGAPAEAALLTLRREPMAARPV
jgi:predicted MPP superfamily phosphohydrolase